MQKQKTRQQQTQKQDIVELIDTSYILDTEIKEKKKVLDANKAKLKQQALIEGKSVFSGELAEAVFSNSITTEIEPEALYNLLAEIGQEELFFELVSVKIGATRERIGDMLLEGIWKQKVTKNSILKFKKRK